MNKQKIEHSLNQILNAANALPIQGEANAAHIVTICHAARMVWGEVNAPEEQKELPEADNPHEE